MNVSDGYRECTGRRASISTLTITRTDFFLGPDQRSDCELIIASFIPRPEDPDRISSVYSPGGNQRRLAIYDTSSDPSEVSTICVGMAASRHCLLCAAPKERYAPNRQFI